MILPRNLKYQNTPLYNGVNPLVRRGDKVKIEAGYYPKIKTLFNGYISKVSNDVPVEIKCEDEMFLLKQTISPNLSYKSVTLKKLLSDVIGQLVPYQSIEADLGMVRIKESSIGNVLKVLRDNYGLFSFFRNGTLYVGLAYYPNDAVTQTILFERQVIEHDLEYLKQDDVKVKVKGVLITETSKQEIEVGDADGDLRTVFQYGGTLAELRRLCNVTLEQANYTGYYGSFTTFLEPNVRQGDYIRLASYKMPERDGVYLVKGVEKSFGVNGGRQIITLERKVQ